MENELEKDYIEELEKIHHQKRKISLDWTCQQKVDSKKILFKP